MEFLDACFNAGLEVVSTVSEMCTSKLKALKLLGVSEQTYSFSFRGQEIAPVFDLPLLLKRTLKLFLNPLAPEFSFKFEPNLYLKCE
jgi:hypothetical protein